MIYGFSESREMWEGPGFPRKVEAANSSRGQLPVATQPCFACRKFEARGDF